jgi:hypothetical protein
MSADHMTAAGDLVLAHHPLIVAVPFFVPAVIVSAVVGLVVWRDRHAPEETRTAQSRDDLAGS